MNEAQLKALPINEQAYVFIVSGIIYALEHNAPPDSREDILHSGFLLYRSILKHEFLTGMTNALCPGGKPPEISEIIHAFNTMIVHLNGVSADISKYQQRFTTLIDTLSEKPHVQRRS